MRVRSKCANGSTRLIAQARRVATIPKEIALFAMYAKTIKDVKVQGAMKCAKRKEGATAGSRSFVLPSRQTATTHRRLQRPAQKSLESSRKSRAARGKNDQLLAQQAFRGRVDGKKNRWARMDGEGR